MDISGMMTAMFKDHDDAERAYQELLKHGYDRDEINVLMTEDSRKRYSGTDVTEGSKAVQGLGTGAAIGGAVGAIVSAIVAVGTSIAIPGLGLVIAGPIAAALAGAGAGGLTGGVIGALVGAGIPEATIKNYETGLREGGVVLGFTPKTPTDAEEVGRVWKQHNAEHIYR